MQLHQKIFNDLFRKISNREYKIGELLHTEKEMEIIYNTSKAPIRQAVAELVNLGMVAKKQGKGTFITSYTPKDNKPILSGFDKAFRSNKHNLTCSTIYVDIIKANIPIAKKLNIKASANILLVKRIRYLTDTPVYFIYHYIPDTRIIEDIRQAGNFESLRSLLSEKFNLNSHNIVEEISATHPNIEVAEALNINSVYPLIKVDRITYNEDYNPIYLTEYFVRSENWKYTVEFSQ
ncbi:MAG: GntR family transcriptional regulator [Maledivibacter sp.]|jgi:GntR family transcriptional regulator|nr:GntR family transcriptional regulator [Maledivibacter sp.]